MRNRLVVLAGLDEHETEELTYLQQRRVGGVGGLEGLEGICERAGPVVRETEVHPGGVQTRIDCQRPLVGDHGLFGLAETRQHCTQVGMRLGEAGIDSSTRR